MGGKKMFWIFLTYCHILPHLTNLNWLEPNDTTRHYAHDCMCIWCR
jgi:hypothetical protein